MIDFDTPQERKLHDLLVRQASRASVPDDLQDRVGHAGNEPPKNGLGGRTLLVAACLLAVAAVAGWAISSARNGSSTEAASPLEDLGAFILGQDDSDRFCETAISTDLVDLIIWMNTTATEDQILTLDVHLAESDALISHRYLNQAETYVEFERFWADSPEVLAAVAPEDLPTSFRLDLLNGIDPASLVTEFNEFDGVLTSEFSTRTC